MSARDQQPGEQFGVWTLEERVGEGGFGVTWRVRGPDGGHAALKILEQPPGNELLALAGIMHPAVVDLIAAGNTPQPHIVMDFVEGRTLTRAEVGRSEIPRLVAAVADGLAAVHAAGINHGDIKPDNIMVGPDGSVRIVDFGASASSACTPAWAAPERLLGAPASMEADVFALGAVAHDLLIDEAAVGDRYRRAPDEDLDAPAWLRTLIADMLSHDPAIRPRASQIADRAVDEGIVLPVPGLDLLTRRARRLYVMRPGEIATRRRWLQRGGVLSLEGPPASGRSAGLRRARLDARAAGLEVTASGGDVRSLDDADDATPAQLDAVTSARWSVIAAESPPIPADHRVVLTPLGQEETSTLLRALLGEGIPASLPALAHTLTDGRPATLVDWVRDALRQRVLRWRDRRWVLDRVALSERPLGVSTSSPTPAGPLLTREALDALLEQAPQEAVAAATSMRDKGPPWLGLWLSQASRDLGRMQDALRFALEAWERPEPDLKRSAALVAAEVCSHDPARHPDAETWLARASRRGAPAQAMMIVRARILRATGRADEGLALLEPYAAAPREPTPEELSAWLRLRVALAQCIFETRGAVAGVASLAEVPPELGRGTPASAFVDASRGRMHFHASQFADAARCFDRAARKEARLPALDRARLLNNSAAARYVEGDRGGALDRWLEARIIFERLGAPVEQLRVDVNIGLGWLEVGRPRRAEVVAHAAIRQARALQAHDLESLAAGNLVDVLLRTDALGEAEQWLGTVRDLVETHGLDGQRAELLRRRAELAVRRRTPDAVSLVTDALDTARALGDPVQEAQLLALLAVATARSGLPGAMSLIADAESTARRAAARGVLADVQLWGAVAGLVTGDTPHAERLLDEVEDWAVQQRDTILWQRARVLREGSTRWSTPDDVPDPRLQRQSSGETWDGMDGGSTVSVDILAENPER